MKPKIWLYRNKETGESKGEATITYDDANAAKSAISWFDNKEFGGAVIHVLKCFTLKKNQTKQNEAPFLKYHFHIYRYRWHNVKITGKGKRAVSAVEIVDHQEVAAIEMEETEAVSIETAAVLAVAVMIAEDLQVNK